MDMTQKTILVVEDELDILANIEKIFIALGCRTMVATSGEEAMEICLGREKEVDLLLTDIILPSMKGHELAKRFLKKSPDTKVLFMSGYISPSISEEDKLNLKKAFIQKPFLPKDLIKISQKLIVEDF